MNPDSSVLTVDGAEVTSSEVLATLPSIVRLNITGTPEPGFDSTVNEVRDLAGNPLTVTIFGPGAVHGATKVTSRGSSIRMGVSGPTSRFWTW